MPDKLLTIHMPDASVGGNFLDVTEEQYATIYAPAGAKVVKGTREHPRDREAPEPPTPAEAPGT